MATASTDFIAVGGNRHPSAAEYDEQSGILAYGADCNVALCRLNDGEAKGVYATLRGHEGIVNAVKFFRPQIGKSQYLLTSAADRTIRVWAQNGNDISPDAVTVVTDASSINAFAVIEPTTTWFPYFVSAAAEPYVKIWELCPGHKAGTCNISLKQKIALSPYYFPLALDLTCIGPSTTIALAVAGTRPVVQVFTSSGDDIDFNLIGNLSGHEGWIRSLSFVRDDQSGSEGDMLLASASHDKYVRLWRFHRGEELPALSQASKDPLLGSSGKTLSNKPRRFTANDEKYSIIFEALLVGHEDWIYTAKWAGSALLTASADNSLALWELDVSSGLWNCTVRLGEINAQKGATTATGSSGGFWIGLHTQRGFMSLGRTGAWRVWKHMSDGICAPDVGVTGHTREARSLAWSRDGTFLLSTSADQTTRLFAEWKRDDYTSWHELSRPQVHGYDLNCIDSLGDSQFVSGADEKLLRVFEKPKNVATMLSGMSGVKVEQASGLPDSAQIPVMGLSNKATDRAAEETNVTNGEVSELLTSDVDSISKTRPPVEDELGRELLWPEVEKLYGHGYEISTVAASRDGTLIATACRASSIDHAVIRLYETKTWQEVKPPLKAHTLTVTSLAFSPDDAFLLSAGRDRQCCLWKRQKDDANQYELVEANSKAHSRMILDGAWLPVGELTGFATAGRDKRLRIWAVNESKFNQVAEIPFEHSVTAVASSQDVSEGVVGIAAGLEDGSIFVVQLLVNTLELRGEPVRLSGHLAPSKAVTCLSWRPHRLGAKAFDKQLAKHSNLKGQLAIASEDSSVRILSIAVPNLSTTG